MACGKTGAQIPAQSLHLCAIRHQASREPGIGFPAEAPGHIQWTRNFWNAVEPFATGQVYVNHLDAEEGTTRIRAAYGRNYDRLVALKNRYDPTNLFRLNQNIKPSV